MGRNRPSNWSLPRKCELYARSTTDHHRLRGSSNRNVFSHSPGGWKSKTKVLVALLSSDINVIGVLVHDGMGTGICAIFGCLRLVGRDSLFLVLYNTFRVQYRRVLEKKYSRNIIGVACFFDKK